jgi:acyl-CoA synthetase (NDP forming)/GNAT superfamily N-acetyltransferase
MIPQDESTLLLRDGSAAIVRDVRDDDAPRLEEMLGRLSAETVRLRFHAGSPHVTAERLFGTGAGRRFVAETGGRLVGAACWIPLTEPGVAELAVVVTDAEHGRGVGMRLVEHVAEGARREGIRRLLALVLAENAPMLDLLAQLGFRTHRRLSGGELEVIVDLADADRYLDARDARDHVGAVASLRPLFEPRGIAVVGASRRPEAVGHAVLVSLLASGFPRGIYAVNPAGGDIAGVPAVGRIADADGPVDVAVVCVPATRVLAVADECIAAGVRVIVVISAGFGEVSAAGAELGLELRRRCRAASVRLVGPNCLGVLSNRAGYAYDATFARRRPPAGRVAISSQSGAVGIALLEQAARLEMGVSSFVSVGNRLDVSPNDLIEAWEDDGVTGVIALYLESFGNPRRFARIARRVAARTPIVALKAGRSEAGARAAASHTAALASREVGVEALFAQAGVVRVDTIEQLFDATRLFASQPVPAGRGVAIVTNAGGFGILCADACVAAGLEVAALSEPTRAALERLLPPEAGTGNPVDVLAATSPEAYGRAVRTVAADPAVDAVLALHAPTRLTGPDEVATALAAAWPISETKTLLACLIGGEGAPAALAAGRGPRPIPWFAFPESAARALGQAARLAAHRRRPRGLVPRFDDIDVGAIAALCDAALETADGDAWLPVAAVRRVLDVAGIRRPASAFAATATEAEAAFRSLPTGRAVAKIVAAGVRHKSDVGGVVFGVTSQRRARQAFQQLVAAAREHGLQAQFTGITIEEEIPAGVECLIGVTADPMFGPLIAFGAGGVDTELLGDVAFRITPLTDVDAGDLLAGVRVRRRLDGFRGQPPGDLAAVRDVLLRIAYLAEELPQLAELDLNPLVALQPGGGAIAADARIRVSRAATRA